MNVLMVNLPFSGHTNPTLPLATKLVKKPSILLQRLEAADRRYAIQNLQIRMLPV